MADDADDWVPVTSRTAAKPDAGGDDWKPVPMSAYQKAGPRTPEEWAHAIRERGAAVDKDVGSVFTSSGFDKFTQQAQRAASFGLTDKLSGLVKAGNMEVGKGINAASRAIGLGTPFPSADQQSFGEVYHDGVAVAREQSDTYAKDHPIMSPVAKTLGSLGSFGGVTGGGAAIPPLAVRLIQAGKAGATAGAVTGVAEGGDKSVGEVIGSAAKGAAFGGLAGLALGGAAEGVSAGVQGFANYLGRNAPASLRDTAVQKILDRFKMDESAGGPTAQQAVDLLNAARQAGKPMTLADIGGENVKALAGNVARTPGPARNAMTSFYTGRDAEAGSRIAGDIDRDISAGGSAFNTADALMTASSHRAAPLYDQALRQENIWSPRLQEFLDDPIMKAGLKKGIELERIDAVTQGRKFDPTQLGIDLDQEGNVIFRKVPNMRVLDAGKRGLDAIIAGEQDAAGKISQRGVTVNQFKRAYVNELDGIDKSGTYKAAREAFSGPMQSKRAIEEGAKILSKKPEEIAAKFADLSPSDREFYKLGAADALKRIVAKTGAEGNEARRIVGNAYVRQQLRPLFNTEEEYTRFVDSVMMENTMFNAAKQVLGGGNVAGKLAEDKSVDLETAAHAASAVRHGLTGNILGMAASLARLGQKVPMGPDRQALNSELGSILTDPNLLAGHSAGMNILQKYSRLMPATRNYLAQAIRQNQGRLSVLPAEGAVNLQGN